MNQFKIIKTNDYGADDRDETFAYSRSYTWKEANRIADNLNTAGPQDRYYLVVPADYVLRKANRVQVSQDKPGGLSPMRLIRFITAKLCDWFTSTDRHRGVHSSHAPDD